jgi:hypothetical protein
LTYKAPPFYIVDYLLGLAGGVLDTFSDQDATFGRMVFRDGLPVRLEQTGKRAVVVSNGTPTSMYANARRPYGNNVQIRFYADHTRELDGDVPLEDGLDRAWAMFGLVDQLLNHDKPLRNDPFVQLDRTSQPLESFDLDQNVPYIVVNYETAVMETP